MPENVSTLTGFLARLGGYLLRPAAATLMTTVAAAVALAVGAYVIVERDREADLVNAEHELQNMTVVLAEQARHAVSTAQLVLDAVADDAQSVAARTPQEFRERLSTYGIYERLKNRIEGLPQIDVTTIVDVDGNVLNFTRSYPPTPINLADRDYFIAHSSGDPQPVFVSAPVKNRGNGEWSFYLSRAIRNPEGQFIGMVLTGLKPAFFADFFKRVAVGDKASLSLFRDDGLLLARYPHIEEAMGRSFRDATSFRILRDNPEGGVMRTEGPRTANASDIEARIVSPRPVPGLPLVVNITHTQDTVLADWQRRTNQVVTGAFLAITLVLVLGAIAFRLLQGREKVLADLVRSKREAEEASRAKTRFLSAMSHEIRTPMNAVLGIAGVLMDTPLDPEQRDKVRLIRDSGDLLLRVLNDILNLGKLDAGKVELENIAFDPRSATDDTVSLIGPRATAKGVSIVLDVDPAVPARLTGDPSRIRQVLFNLVGNAVKFTDRGRVTVGMARGTSPRGEPQIVWTIADTGVGIPAGRLSGLFGEFVQADSSISRRFGGTGLGLAISKRLVELMGGTIAVDSQEGKGTTVRFSVPLVEAPAEAAVAPQDGGSERKLDEALARRGRPLRLLIAEDNTANQYVARAILQHAAITVDVVGNGVEAVEAITRRDYDMVLMDVQMPEMDGLAATRLVRQRGGHYARVPIIAFSANAFSADIEAFREAGMNDSVTKPVRKDALLAAILRNLPPPAETVQPPAFDPAALEALTEDIGRDGCRRTVAMFLDLSRRRLAELPALAADAARARVEVHALKGAGRMVGAVRLAAVAEGLEHAIAGGAPCGPAEIEKLKAPLEDFCQAPEIRALLAETPPAAAAE